MTCPSCGGPLVKCWRRCIALIVLLLVASTASAQVYRIETLSHRTGATIKGTGTAVCIGYRGNTGLFLTAKHNLRSVESFVVRGDFGTSEGYRTSLHPTEDVAAFCARGDWKTMAMSADEIPDGAPVQVCGFGPAAHGVPDQFCFAASISGEILTGKSHVIPGDSGGAAYVGLDDQHVLVGIVSAYLSQPGSGYSGDRNDGKSRESLIVPISAVAEWLPTQYSNCPQCIPLRQPRALPPRRMPPIVTIPQQQGPTPEQVRQIVIDYLRANPPRDGRDGANGRDAEVDYAAIVSAVLAEIPNNDALLQRIAALEKRQQQPGTVHVIVTDNGKEVFNRSGVPDGSTVRVPITRVER